ncbi:MAG: 16S rRNA (guanine(966)-N(2))-methyltransferase RsmD [Burkholderiales bacterium]
MASRIRRRPNTLRIIGGAWRGRLVHFPDADTLRPTPDRVRETLFNWLGQDLTGLRCLDLFAGSGVLGLEALSRNAGQVTFVEQSRGVCRAVAESAKSLGATDFQLHCCDALEFLRREDRRLRDAGTAGPFDIVFLDPPYGQDWIENVLPRLAPIVSPDARMYFEADQTITALEGWAILKSAKAGMVHYGLAMRKKQ